MRTPLPRWRRRFAPSAQCISSAEKVVAGYLCQTTVAPTGAIPSLEVLSCSMRISMAGDQISELRRPQWVARHWWWTPSPSAHCISSAEKAMAGYRRHTTVTPTGAIPSLEASSCSLPFYTFSISTLHSALRRRDSAWWLLPHPYLLDGHEVQVVLDASERLRWGRVAPTMRAIFARWM